MIFGNPSAILRGFTGSGSSILARRSDSGLMGTRRGGAPSIETLTSRVRPRSPGLTSGAKG